MVPYLLIASQPSPRPFILLIIYSLRLKARLITLACCCLLTLPSVAQYSPAPSDSLAPPAGPTKWTSSTLFRTAAAPAGLVVVGLLTVDNALLDRFDVQRARQRAIPNFRTSADDYLIFTPIVAVYGLDALGVKARHRFGDRTLRLLTAEAISQAIVLPLKTYTHVERPDGSDFRSFPSGHTAQAFVGATFMHKELGSLSPWYSIGAYTTATAMGVLRIMNNKHWLSDVLVGAGAGLLSTNVAYLFFPHDRHRRERTTGWLIMPRYQAGNVGVYASITLP